MKSYQQILLKNKIASLIKNIYLWKKSGTCKFLNLDWQRSKATCSGLSAGGNKLSFSVVGSATTCDVDMGRWFVGVRFLAGWMEKRVCNLECQKFQLFQMSPTYQPWTTKYLRNRIHVFHWCLFIFTIHLPVSKQFLCTSMWMRIEMKHAVSLSIWWKADRMSHSDILVQSMES